MQLTPGTTGAAPSSGNQSDRVDATALPVIDANELLWAARVLASLVRVHRNVIPAVRENVKLAEAILASYADLPDFDPREQRWMIGSREH